MRNPNAKVSDPNIFATCPGEDEHILYASKIMPDGTIKLTPSGKESISEKINAEKEFTDISYIVSRLQAGDTSMLRDGAVYGDFTKAPSSLAEALQLKIDAETAFYALPKEVRAKFNNNVNLWIMEAGEDDWNEKMNIIKEKVEEVEKESEVVES